MKNYQRMEWNDLFEELEIDVRQRHESPGSHETAAKAWAEVRSRIFKLVERRLSTWRELRETDAASDLTQMVMLRLQRPEFVALVRRLDSPDAYLSVVIRRLILDLVRRQSAEAQGSKRLAVEPLPPAIDEDVAGRIASLRREIGSLTTSQRELLRLRFVDGLSIGDIALRQDRSYSSVAVRLFRTLRKLKYRLSK